MGIDKIYCTSLEVEYKAVNKTTGLTKSTHSNCILQFGELVMTVTTETEGPNGRLTEVFLIETNS